MFLIDVIQVQPLPERRLKLTFEDGLKATVDLDAIVKTYRGVFLPLLDDRFFQQVRVDAEVAVQTPGWGKGGRGKPKRRSVIAMTK